MLIMNKKSEHLLIDAEKLSDLMDDDTINNQYMSEEDLLKKSKYSVDKRIINLAIFVQPPSGDKTSGKQF